MKMKKSKVILIISIDTECDKGPNWEVKYPLRFLSVTHGIPNLLTPLFKKYGIKPTYLLSPEVMKDKESVHVLSFLEHCELGTHLHGEFISPDEELGACRTDTPQLLYSPEVEREKLVNLTNLFEKRFGYRPRSFRAGRFGISRFTLKFLEELGYWVDSSITPFRSHNFGNGLVSDHWGAPLEPYFPSLADPRVPGNLSILEVPVTIIIPQIARCPAWALRTIGRFGRIRRLIVKRFGPPRWLRPLRGTPTELIATAEAVISAWKGKGPPILNIMFHSVEVIPGANPYTKTQKDVDYLLDSLNQLFEHLYAKYKVISLTLSEIAQWAKRGWKYSQQETARVIRDELV